ncbi:ligand-dependent corepressor isoform X2 [Eleutherodactylus coqui]|uniref:Uncharacterized protein n=2 Tax=Eleutherodactylus coqui TaxID=57060 RepID=A0A8J6FDQ6_ELECQ|nr:hypothetical protein GDO78_008033 [Eleutherodactylus coqui]
MQRMIRQFAAEYTSKNSSTQDSSPPNSTKNQSLPKSPSGQSSPPPATTQNPVLSKLLMADQDSPLDLTVKRPHSEEPCEQADGVLDLSTKKSPSSGSPNSSISPSTSNTIGNGTQDTERKAIDPNNSTSVSLETFMAKLCSHHQKQFILVLNNLCTEEAVMKSKRQSASVSEIENANIEVYDHSCSNRKVNFSLVQINKSAPETCLNCKVPTNTPTTLHEDNYHSGMPRCSDYLSKVSISSDSKEDHAIDQIITDNPVGIPTTEEKAGTIFAKTSEVGQTVFLEHGVLSHSNSALNTLNDSPGSDLPTNVPKIANKENTQYMNPNQTLLDCSDCKLNQENSVTSVTVKMLGNLCESPFQNLTDHSGSALQKVRLHENKRLKTVKCKHSRVLMTNDCDKQCDVVYISEPITPECHFENHKAIVGSRKTARKSTRGYLFSDDCCELSTVRTLIRSSKVEDKGNSAIDFAKALIIPNDLIETLPSTDVASLIHVVEKSVETGSFNSLQQNDELREIIPNCSRSESENCCDQSFGMARKPVDHVSDSFIALFSLTQDELEKAHVPSTHSDLALREHVDEIPKMKPNPSVVNIDSHSLSVNDHEKSVVKLAVDPDVDVSCSNNSYSQVNRSGTTLLDMGVSITNNRVLSEHNATPPKCYPHNTVVEETSVTLQCSHTSLPSAYSSSLPNGIPDKDFPHFGSSSLVETKILPAEISEAVITDPAVTSEQQLLMKMSSGDLPKENSESQIFKASQVDLSSAVGVMNLHQLPGPSIGANNVHLIDFNRLENLKNGLARAFNHSVKMETKDRIFESVNTPQSLVGQLNCPVLDSLRPMEHFQSPLNKCAKHVGNSNERLEANVSIEDMKPCDSVTSSGCHNNYTLEEPLKTKEVNGESKMVAVNLGKNDNFLMSNKNTSKPQTASKKHKKIPAPTDRCLRSRETHGDPPLQKIPSLLVLVSYIKDTNSAERFVELKTENTTCANIINSRHDTSHDENDFAASLNSHRERKPLLYERMLSNYSSPFKMSENLKICLLIDCDKRMVSFAKESQHNCVKMDAESKCSTANLRNACQLQLQKCNKRPSENASNCRTRSSTKHVALKILKNTKYCKSNKSKNLSENKQINRPKFIDWCSEEENQERISNFNDKYTTVHKNWIPLERETANVTKSKNKADRLKEIWKTKKRVRRPKSVQDAPRTSPVQMLFINSFKLSDVCRWFMETTETKSLVIVKKLNTRLPEEHQLPMMPSPKYSNQSLYPHIQQAQRLKKHLKKFASVFPARNDIPTQNSLNQLMENSIVPLNQVPKDTVKEPTDCKKQEPYVKKTASVHILQKYNRLRDNLKYQSSTVSKHKKVLMIKNTESKLDHVENIKDISTKELSLQKIPNALASPPPSIKPHSKKRCRNDSMTESVERPNKKKKVEAKQEILKNRSHINKIMVPTKTKACNLSKINLTSNSQAPKKQVGKAAVYKASLRKEKAKTPMQKQSHKSQFVLKHETRSTKLRPGPPNLSDSPKITSLSSSHRKKELHKKICNFSANNKINVASKVRHRKPRSQPGPPTRNGRSLEIK